MQCAFAPNHIETAEHLSKLTGQTTVVKEQITTSGQFRRPGRFHDKKSGIFRPEKSARPARYRNGPALSLDIALLRDIGRQFPAAFCLPPVSLSSAMYSHISDKSRSAAVVRVNCATIYLSPDGLRADWHLPAG